MSLSQAVHESGSFNSQELSIIFWALAKLQHTPPAAWVAGLLREGLEVAGGLQAQSLVLLMGALTRWDLPQMHTAGHYRSVLSMNTLMLELSVPLLVCLSRCRFSTLSSGFSLRMLTRCT